MLVDPTSAETQGSLSRTTFTLGMPHLSIAGLSDQWLLRECGHAHWLLLERFLGSGTHQWHDESGRRLYASFIAISITGALLGTAREGQQLVLASRVERTGTNAFLSTHSVNAEGSVDTAHVELVSVFVRRSRLQDNQSFRPGMPLALNDSLSYPSRHLPLLEDRRAIRADVRRELSVWGIEYPVVPIEDFNSLGMVYFASYPRYVDRAEWERAGRTASTDSSLLNRRLFYYSNLNAGDHVRLDLVPGGERVASRWVLTSVSTGRLVCVSETLRPSTIYSGNIGDGPCILS